MVDTEAADFGKLIHSIIVNYFSTIPEYPSEDQIRQILEKLFNEQEALVPQRLRRRYREILENLIDFEIRRRRTWRKYKPDLIEARIEARPFKDLPKLIGIVDFFSAEEGVLLDWKTGTSEENSYLRQAAIYKLILEENGLTVNRVLFLSLLTGRALTVPRVTTGWVYKIIKDMVDAIDIERFYPNPGYWCRNCEYILDCQYMEACLWII